MAMAMPLWQQGMEHITRVDRVMIIYNRYLFKTSYENMILPTLT